MTARVRIERRDAHKTVYPGLRLEVSIGIGAVHLDGYAFDAAFRLQDVDDIHRITAFFRPPGIHSQKHADPVIGFRAAGAGVDGQEGGGGIILIGEELEDLQLRVSALEGSVSVRELLFQGFVLLLGSQAMELFQVFEIDPELLPGFESPLEGFEPGQDVPRALLVLPEVGAGGLLLYPRNFGFQRVGVKAPSMYLRFSPRGPRSWAPDLLALCTSHALTINLRHFFSFNTVIARVLSTGYW